MEAYCDECGRKFDAKVFWHIYCGPKCRSLAQAKRLVEKHEKKEAAKHGRNKSA
jgi:hypothetical protein